VAWRRWSAREFPFDFAQVRLFLRLTNSSRQDDFRLIASKKSHRNDSFAGLILTMDFLSWTI